MARLGLVAAVWASRARDRGDDLAGVAGAAASEPGLARSAGDGRAAVFGPWSLAGATVTVQVARAGALMRPVRRLRVGCCGGPAIAGEVPREPPGYVPRGELLAGPGSGDRDAGVGKTQLAAACARARLAEGWRLVAWVDAEIPAGLLAGLAETIS